MKKSKPIIICLLCIPVSVLFGQSDFPDSIQLKKALQLCETYFSSNDYDSSIYYGDQVVAMNRIVKNINVQDKVESLLFECYTKTGKIHLSIGMSRKASGALRAKMLIDIGEYYVFKPGLYKKTLDSALPYIWEAINYSRKENLMRSEQDGYCLLGKYYFSLGNFDSARICFIKNINGSLAVGDKSTAAHWWSEFGIYMPLTKTTFPENVYAFSRARQIYESVGDEKSAMYAYREIGYAEEAYGNIYKADSILRYIIRKSHDLEIPNVYTTYLRLALVESEIGNFNNALDFGFKARTNFETLKIPISARYFKTMGDIYWEINDIPNALHSYEQSLTLMKYHFLFDIHKACFNIIQAYIMLGDLPTAWKRLLTFTKNYPAVRSCDRETMKAAYAGWYFANHDYELAEKFYKEMIQLDEKSIDEESKDFVMTSSVYGSEAQLLIGRFYVSQLQFKAAIPYLLKAFILKLVIKTPLSRIRDIYELLYKADSAIGDYPLALKNLSIFKQLSDSMVNVTKNRQIAELLIRYETEKKDRDLILQKKSNQLLVKQSEYQGRELSYTMRLRNLTLVGIVLMILISGLLYSRYRIKQRANIEIRNKNKELEQLLRDKDWLVKEIHHRVKNNLQTIVSLLESQSVNLKSEALEAVQDSRNRIYAMSLIHQKLYQTETNSSISMEAFFPDLIENLRESFNVRQRIRFCQDIEPIVLDVSQAIPIGLILNEVVINSIKYAFPTDRVNNEVNIYMGRKSNGVIEFRVSDNGIGLSRDFETKAEKGLGIKLMRGLTEELHGFFCLDSFGGTRIRITFNPKFA
jgi:two-component sensor histidine kinase